MTRLSVNVNKIATLRNARGGDVPNVLQVALDCERFGAEGITVHPRPDERHIRYSDVLELNEHLTTEFNIEGNPDDRFIKLIERAHPTQVTLVPDAPGVLTSNAGWDVEKHFDHLKSLIDHFHGLGVRTSIFVGTSLPTISAARETGTDRIELYTEPYASAYHQDRDTAVAPFVQAAAHAHKLGLAVNAGHDLNLDNLAFFAQSLGQLEEVSIGHALIADALYMGLERTIAAYLSCLKAKA
ncbi:pyridoxine 5'-phosphate synthase [Porphyromonas crevioricanis JCM 15906]|uniref:Pyridoxine 5'-phosphate synthase n=1 Tax=Porphyromonas crevioricanis JCM 15906 TaxID=1305617 RepID=T1DR31_9PORP|nr:pyridoxine 5'-phosphate synthase [Porphyromonas crevioricanis]GAD04659.1 pyridoxine 5'-phosphate synthase [Porphyromonas crevioricanis JCM 15906]SJZ67016.1 pyridoxine 5'-phosphate synthase [Porphyromonas crevioricanis]